MPTAQLKKLHKLTGKPLKELESYWNKAKAIAAKKMPKSAANYWAYVEGIFKNMARVKTATASNDFEQSLSAFVSISKPMAKPKKKPASGMKKKKPTVGTKKKVAKVKTKPKSRPTKKVTKKAPVKKLSMAELPDWWKKKSPKSQEAYLKNHPNSKFAKNLAKVDKKAAAIVERARKEQEGSLLDDDKPKPQVVPKQEEHDEGITHEPVEPNEPTDNEKLQECIKHEVSPEGNILFGLARKAKKLFEKNVHHMSNTLRHHKQGMEAINKWAKDGELSKVEQHRAQRTAGVAAKLVVGTLVGMALFTPLAGLAVELGKHFLDLGPAGEAAAEALSNDDAEADADSEVETKPDPETEFLTKMHDWLLNQDMPALIDKLQQMKDAKKEAQDAGE